MCFFLSEVEIFSISQSPIWVGLSFYNKRQTKMDDRNYEILELIRLRLLGEDTLEKRERLDAWLEESEAHRVFFEAVRRCEGVKERQELFVRIHEEEALRHYDRRIGYRRRRQLVYLWRACAAVAVVAIVAGVLARRDTVVREEPMAARESVVLLETNQATLRLASGEEVVLSGGDTVRQILQDKGVKAETRDGGLVYADSASADTVPQYNELSTPRAGEYQVTLADGSRVWLNASSRLRYPVAFGRGERLVSLEGEAYFEVARDSVRPFIVRANGASVKVYGTEFDVRADGEQVRTVLVKGRVGVTIDATGEERMLWPDQLLAYDRATGDVDVREVDTYAYVAWKYGEFVFNDERLEDIMDRLLEWYDAEVFYVNEAAKDARFTGIVPRFEDVDDVLQLLEGTATVRFQVRGKTITVSGL